MMMTSNQIPSSTLAQPSEELSSFILNVVLPRRPPRLHRKNHGYSRDESCFSVRSDNPKCQYILAYMFISRSLIANFEFEPAYEGQVALPTAAVTMSRSWLYYSVCSWG